MFDQLRSTSAVLDCLFIAAAGAPLLLDEEPVRFYELAAADAAAPPKDIDTGLAAPGGTLFSTPRLPQAPAGSDGTHAHLVICIMLEDVATSLLRDSVAECDWFTVLSDFDRLPARLGSDEPPSTWTMTLNAVPASPRPAAVYV